MQLPKTIEQMKAGIEALDLDAIKIKLLSPSENDKGWNREYVDQLEIAYRRFLFLSVKYPDAPTVPTKDIDTFWHYHILDTMKYAEDCQNTFGFFLHHFPYIGLRGEEDAANLQKASTFTRDLYEQEFGESMSISNAICTKSINADSAICTKSINADSAICTKSINADSAICTKSINADSAICTKSINADSAICTKSINADSAICTKSINADSAICTKSINADSAICTKSINADSAICTKSINADSLVSWKSEADVVKTHIRPSFAA